MTVHQPRPKIAETVIHPTAKLREAQIGTCCEVLADSSLEYMTLGDYSYVGQRCMIGDTVIGKFCAIAAEVALGLAFDPRYRDFPFAPLGAAAAPFLVLTFFGAAARRRELAEIVMATVLGASTVYVAWNEGIANWQSLCLCAVFAAIVIALLRPRAEPSSK